MGKGTRHSPASHASRRESSSRAKVYHRAELASSRLSQRAPAPAPNLARVSSGSDWHLRAKDTRPGLSSAFAAENSWQRLWRGGSLRCSPFGNQNHFDLALREKKRLNAQANAALTVMSTEEKEGTIFTKTLRQLVTILLRASLI